MFQMQLKYRGVSTIFAIVFLGIAATSFLLMIFQVSNNINFSDHLTEVRRYRTLVKNLQKVLENPQSCRVALEGQRVNQLYPGGISFITTLRYPYKNQLIILQPNFFFSEVGLSIDQIRLLIMRPKLWRGQQRIIQFDRPSPPLTSWEGRIIITARNTQNRLVSVNLTDLLQGIPENIAKNSDLAIDLVINVDASQNITTCHGVRSLAAACEEAGGAFDSSPLMDPWPNLRCHPNYRCWIEGNGARRTSAPPLPDSPILPACPWPYNHPMWAGRIEEQDVWYCEWCNNQSWNPGVD